MDAEKEALELHERHRGKIEIKSKIPIKDKKDLSLAYTPGVASPCLKIAENKEEVYRYTMKGNSVAVVTDGSSVLGLGNIGAEAAIPVMEGKALLFKEFAGVDAFPICIKTQNPEKIIEIVKNIAPIFGGINLEDIKAPECFIVEDGLQGLGIPVMHDDQHGTAVVVLAGMINSLKLTGKKKEDVKIVVNGAGAAGIAVSKMLLKYGFKNLVLCDSKGVIHKGRGDLDGIKKEMAELTNLACHYGLDKEGCVIGNLESALNKSDVFIGVSKGGLLSHEQIRKMNEKSIVFAMANPIPEIMPDEALKGGAFIVATGRSDFPNQVNNVLAFPGIFRGALDVRAGRITDKMKIAAAEALAGSVGELGREKILPSVFDKNVSLNVAEAVKNAWSEDKI